jgi:H-type small acid-soluble spore protein
MQLRRAVEIMNSNNKENIVVYYNDRPVTIESVDNNIGTAHVKTLNNSMRMEVNLEELTEPRR